jgi:dienelactone hydrolase
VVTENDVGPTAGVTENGAQRRFVLIRPKDLAQGGRCHPVITWGNGYGDNPPTYMVLLRQLASHGFVVVASLSHYVSQTPDGGPPPMQVGVDWVLQQNEDPASALYGWIDTSHVGATGHSAGGFATSQLGSDPRIGAIATICGAAANANLHGPALLLCGGQDTVATCTRMQSAFDGITSQPVMLADQLSATHGSWIGSIKDPFMIAVTAWMRHHLMGDTSQRGVFYGPDCALCRNPSVWKIQRKQMSE